MASLLYVLNQLAIVMMSRSGPYSHARVVLMTHEALTELLMSIFSRTPSTFRISDPTTTGTPVRCMCGRRASSFETWCQHLAGKHAARCRYQLFPEVKVAINAAQIAIKNAKLSKELAHTYTIQ
jgi:hypothetical protein